MDEVTRMIVEVGTELIEDFRFRNEILGPIEVWGLERFDANWMVIKGQIKTRPLQHWSVTRAFNARLKLKMDEAGIEIPVPWMQVHTSSKERNSWPQPDDYTEDESRQTTGANSSARRRPDMSAPPELSVRKEPPFIKPPASQTVSTSSATSPDDDTVRK
jgi:small conductance mechanosensitive channel